MIEFTKNQAKLKMIFFRNNNNYWDSINCFKISLSYVITCMMLLKTVIDTWF